MYKVHGKAYTYRLGCRCSACVRAAKEQNQRDIEAQRLRRQAYREQDARSPFMDDAHVAAKLAELRGEA